MCIIACSSDVFYWLFVFLRFLKEVVVYDVQAKDQWHCVFDNWLAVDKGFGSVQAQIPAINQKEMLNRRTYQLFLKSSQDFRKVHLWISIFSKPSCDSFTRAQRLTCGLLLLITNMMTSMMFHGIPTDDPKDQLNYQGGSLSLSGNGLPV